jgi:hypothetical protein
MDAKDIAIGKSPCSGSLPDIEVPMINTMVACLGVEHRKLNDLNMQLAYAATRLASDPGAIDANQTALQVWDDIRQDLWSHLQIEDELVFSWGPTHQAIPGTLIETLKNERQEMRRLMIILRTLTPHDCQPRPRGDRSTIALTLVALALILDSHVERYEGEVMPSILRALVHK